MEILWVGLLWGFYPFFVFLLQFLYNKNVFVLNLEKQ